MILKIDPFEDDELCLFGIISSEKDYRLCFAINHATGLEFEKSEDYEIHSGKIRTVSYFSRYQCLRDKEGNGFFLFSNKGTTDFLIPEYRKMDFWLLVRGEFDAEDLQDMLQKIKNHPSVLGVYPIDFKTLKSREHLVF